MLQYAWKRVTIEWMPRAAVIRVSMGLPGHLHCHLQRMLAFPSEKRCGAKFHQCGVKLL